LAEDEFESLVEDSLPRHSIGDVEGVEDMFPATPLHEALVMSRSIDSDLYAVQVIHKISEKNGQLIDIDRLQVAWEAVVDRHQSLRTVFVDTVSDHSALTQVIMKHMPQTSTRLICETDSDALTLLQRPVEPNQTDAWCLTGPAHFTICHATASNKTYCKIEVNHAVTDGASGGIITQDLGLAYDGALAAGPGPLYRDFVSYLLSSGQQASLDYWAKYLKEFEPCIINDGMSTGSERQLRDIEFEVTNTAAIRTFSAANSVTLASIFQAAWSVVLRSFSETEDVCFGYLNAGRDAPVNGIRDAVGLFINMLVSRINFSEEITVGDLVRKVQSDYLDALSHKNCSLAEMQRFAGQPLFNSIMSFQVISKDNSDQGSLSFEQVSAHDPTEYALSISVAAAENSVWVTLSHYTDVIPDFLAGSIATSFEKAVSSLVKAGPHTPARDVNIMGDKDIERIGEWNGNPLNTV
jgi:hypothetical protein